MSNESSEYGKLVTSPIFHSKLVNPFFNCSFDASSIIAGVRSIPVTFLALSAKAHATIPGPQATSKTSDLLDTPDNINKRAIASSAECA